MWPLMVKSLFQTLKILKLNISKTVRENVSIEVKEEVVYVLSNGENIFTSRDL